MEAWDKVVLYGVVDGLNLHSDGNRDIFVTLENGDRVDIPEYFARKASNLIEKNNIKLKDVIARIKKLDLGIQEVWLNEILNELGGDYGSLKYRAGYEQGRFDSAMEREKVTIPQFVADWIEYAKFEDYHLLGAMDSIAISGRKNLDEWFRGDDDNMELFARAWLDGYEVEEKKRYYVRFKGMESNDFNYLNFIKFQRAWVLSSLKIDKKFRTEHTRKELEDAGFGWVFDCPGIEIEEVEE